MLLEQAIQYAERGWAVLPLHSVIKGQCTCGKSGCHSAGKHPQTMNGLKSATTDKDTINTWFKHWPKANIGIATGSISGIAVLDIDPKHGGEDTLHELTRKYTKIPDTVEAITQSRGRHIIFQHDESFRTTAGKLGRGIDTRGDGGYIVAAPSQGLLGRYEWESSSEPENCPIVKPPSWMLNLLNENRNLEYVAEKLGPGLRNAYLCSIGGMLRSRGVSYKGIVSCLHAENLERCHPPLTELEVWQIARSMMRYDVRIDQQKVRMKNEVH